MPLAQTTVTDATTGFAAGIAAALAFIPHLIGFLLILVLGYFAATFLGKLVVKLLEKVGFDRAVERGGLRTALAASGYHPSQLLGKIAFYTIFLFVLELAFGVFGPNPISDLLTRVIAFLPNVFVAIVIVVLSASIAAAAKDIVRATLGGLSYGKMLANVAAGAIVLFGGVRRAEPARHRARDRERPLLRHPRDHRGRDRRCRGRRGYRADARPLGNRPGRLRAGGPQGKRAY